MNLLAAALLPHRNRLRLVALPALDGLTGISSRCVFDEGYAAAVASSAVADHPLSVLLVDVDSLTHYNDTYGYRRGDDALRIVAGCIAGMPLRRGDLAAHYGGASFGIILPMTDVNGAAKVGYRLRTEVAGRKLEHRDSVYGLVTLSIGIGTLSGRRLRTADGPARLIAMAETGLRCAKENGRNRIEHSETAPGLRVA
jgi:diguanylate cyclase (GGDEF)-like protein